MNDSTNKLIEQLSSKLGTTVEHLWGVLVQQVYINAISDLVLIVAFGFIFYTFHKLANKNRETWFGKPDLYNDREMYTATMIFFWFVVTAYVIFAVNGVADSIKAFINPEYYALRSLIVTVK